MQEGHEAGDVAAASRRCSVCVAPWYSVLARGFIPRVYVLDDGGWPVRYVDGAVAVPTYEQAVAIAALLRVTTDQTTAA